MTRSRRRKLQRLPRSQLYRSPGSDQRCRWRRCSLAGSRRARPAGRSRRRSLEEIIVTAQKRQENLQDVPMSIQALAMKLRRAAAQQLRRLHEVHAERVASRPGARLHASVFMRGVASGDNGNHSGPMPSVGLYLDEQPITTIQGALDIHIYDIARVEALAGPQGTLYGASSQAGTIRIITNKPDPTKFSASYDLEGTRLRTATRATLPKALSTCRSTTRPRCASSAGTSTTPATSTT